MRMFLVAFIILIASPLANSSSGWIFYGRRRPSMSAMAKGLLPQSERVAAENKSKGEVIAHRKKNQEFISFFHSRIELLQLHIQRSLP